MKLVNICNDHCDVRDYMTVNMNEEVKGALADELGIEINIIDTILESASIYVSDPFNTEIKPFDIMANL